MILTTFKFENGKECSLKTQNLQKKSLLLTDTEQSRHICPLKLLRLKISAQKLSSHPLIYNNLSTRIKLKVSRDKISGSEDDSNSDLDFQS